MNESKIFRIDIDKIIRDKAGDKAKRIPRFIVSWLKRIIHQDEINAFLEKEGDKQGVPWLKDCVFRYLEACFSCRVWYCPVAWGIIQN